MKKNSRSFVILIATLVVLVVNALANILPIAGVTTGEVSDSINNLFAPAGYVFSIWGLIYLGLVAFVVYAYRNEEEAQKRVEAIWLPYVLSCAFNAAWIFAWHTETFWLSLILMVALFASLLIIFIRLAAMRQGASIRDRWMCHIPFSIYTGWISVALIANAALFLVDAGWSGWGITPEVWTILMLIIATAIGLITVFRNKDAAFGLVFSWAFTGIAARSTTPASVVTVALVSGCVMLIAALLALYKVARAARLAKAE